MSTFKCKMCGGALEIQPGQTVAKCEYCGTQQTLPKLDDDRRANLYDRANHFRRNNEFDKAMGIYESILNEDNTDSEAYWSLVLCRYGIEYVEDPATHKRVPTVNRAQFTSIFDDKNYKSAVQYADTYQRIIYETEAKAINEIQKGILAISQQEEPFDVFICYKESDNNGRRTPDSVLANDLYHQLTLEGFKVFFARITLEDKLGSAYEPYIFAALNSAKVMVVLGTKPEYFSAVWVRNEWSRYLALIKQGQKKMLIPAYKDMDPYDLPEEFSHLQAQDMVKLGFMQDLIRGIKKITQVDAPQTTVVRETVISEGTSNTAPLLKRAFMFLEDGDWASADEYCEKVLDIDPENGEAYLVKTLAQEKCRTIDAFTRKRKDSYFAAKGKSFQLEPNKAHIAEMAKKFAIHKYFPADTIRKLYEFNLVYTSTASERKAQYRLEEEYWANHKLLNRVEKFAKGALAENLAREKESLFTALSEHIKQAEAAEKTAYASLVNRYSEFLKKTDAEVEERHQKALGQLEADYDGWLQELKEADQPMDFEYLEKRFEGLGYFRDSKNLAEYCRRRAKEVRAQAAENARKEAARIAKRKIRIPIIAASIVCAIIAFIIVLTTVIIPDGKYNDAIDLMNAGNMIEAYEALVALDGYKDSAEKANSIYGEYKMAKLKIAQVGDYVLFGSYEQDGNTSNGTEEIEWLVLEVKDGKALVISHYALDCQQYNTIDSDVTWETCSLREWLNGTFLNAAFTSDEQAVIPIVTVSADKNQEFRTDPGNATQDKVFLLSITEANKYFSSDTARICETTSYASANGVGSFLCCWWLRSPGYRQDDAVYVNYYGEVANLGHAVTYENTAVRPAMWIDLSTLE